MSLNEVLLRVDRLAAGRQRDVRVPAIADPTLRRDWLVVRVLLGVAMMLGVSAIGIAFWLTMQGMAEPLPVWMRSVVVLGLTGGLGYFSFRAEQGWYWAYARMRMFAFIFPCVTLVFAAVPGLYPAWMTLEQLAFAALMLTVGVLLTTPRMRAAYRRDA
ncbi:hypothetical protein GCM10022219_16910 [Microbacterium oryzae]|uniref:Uncharacterized protein n=1 Tax=Microbacterium oryzae TaxID=743009 RepID=A0A6I6E6F0_9MICO|nr:hypothetical protein [Microbacterium oryzae]QGU28010.1 hypothetical protein D7D94_10260 [Microbacterium oryzae]